MPRVQQVHEGLGRAVGLDLHREFCEIATCESGQTYGSGRVRMTAEGIEALAESLEPTDRVVMEVSSSAWEVARPLERHCQRVVSRGKTGGSRPKTDSEVTSPITRSARSQPELLVVSASGERSSHARSETSRHIGAENVVRILGGEGLEKARKRFEQRRR